MSDLEKYYNKNTEINKSNKEDLIFRNITFKYNQSIYVLFMKEKQ